MLILASKSPQREMLLRQIGIEPVVIPAHIESKLDVDNLYAAMMKLAADKAKTALAKINAAASGAPFNETNDFWIIGADTVILFNGSILGKAQHKKQAQQMLELLSGRTHQVLTGIFGGKVERERNGNFAISSDVSNVADTAVIFKSLSAIEIAWYLSSEEWREAAGAYRIQGRGACLVTGIKGSFSNVVGLPLESIYGMLLQLGFLF